MEIFSAPIQFNSIQVFCWNLTVFSDPWVSTAPLDRCEVNPPICRFPNSPHKGSVMRGVDVSFVGSITSLVYRGFETLWRSYYVTLINYYLLVHVFHNSCSRVSQPSTTRSLSGTGESGKRNNVYFWFITQSNSWSYIENDGNHAWSLWCFRIYNDPA